MTRAERLSRQGVAFVEVDGVLARLTKAQSADVSKFARAVDAVALAAPLAVRMRERVRERRQPAAGELPGYGSAAVMLSEQYAQRAGLSSQWWRSSDAMHAALGQGRGYHVTGGMWAGLQVRGSGKASAVIDFGGSSIGRGQVKIVRLRYGRTIARVLPVMVRNSQKAGGIYLHHKINVVEPTMAEVEACAGVLLERLVHGWQVAAAASPPAAPTRIDSGDTRLSDLIRDRLRRGGGSHGL